jgi:hypothetical protein
LLANLPTDVEAATEQRVMMASFEMQRRDQSAWRLMVTERRAAADRLAETQQRARHSAHLRNMAAAREARATAVLARASQREH